MKKGTILLETIFSIALFSIIAFYSINIILDLSQKNHSEIDNLNNILKLETTRLFIQKHTLEDVRYENNTLIYKGQNILLDNVSSFVFSKNGKLLNINICLEKNGICQRWIIK